MALPLPNPDISPSDRARMTMSGLNALQKGRLENKYAPLEMAIKAQNSMAYNSRTGNIGLFFKALSQMPAAERQAYLADPENRAQYLEMVRQFKSGINNPFSSGNIITPELLRQAGFNVGNQNPMANIAYQKPSENENASPNAMNNIPNMGASNRASPELIEDIAQNGNDAYRVPGTNKFKVGNETFEAVPQEGTAYTPEEAARINQVESEEPNNSLSQKERGNLNSQLLANNKSIGRTLQNRADAAIAFDKFLQLHRKEISESFKDAAYYNQLYGRGKNWLQKFQQDQPEKYANYINAKNSLTPLMGNGIRFLEAMGVSHEAQEDAKNQVSVAIDKLDVSPETAIKVFNKHMKALQDLSSGVLSTAEPVYPGARKKLSGLKDIKGDFITMKNSPPKNLSASQSDLEYTANKYGMTIEQVKQKLGLK
jgi:hypothetical protein